MSVHLQGVWGLQYPACGRLGQCHGKMVWYTRINNNLFTFTHSTYGNIFLCSGMQLQRQIVPPLRIIKYAERWLLDAMIATRLIQKYFHQIL